VPPLPAGGALRGGDVLVADDGSLLRVRAAVETLLTVRACAEHGSPADLLRAAYHLGQRHVPLQLAGDGLRLANDPALAAWLRAMHLIVSEDRAAFEPEGEAAAQAHEHAHDHGHPHDHDHGHHRH
jgi:urease accessory protein